MLSIAPVTPLSGVPFNVNIIYQSGWIEIVNDTAFALSIALQGSLVTLAPGLIELYEIPDGGTTLTINPVAYISLMRNTPLNRIFINQYQPWERPQHSYPVFLVRSVQEAPVTSDGAFSTASDISIATNLSIQLTPAQVASETLFVTGYDIFIQKGSAASQVILTLHNCFNSGDHIAYIDAQSASSVNIMNRFPRPIVVPNQSAAVTLSYPASGGATAPCTIVLYILVQ